MADQRRLDVLVGETVAGVLRFTQPTWTITCRTMASCMSMERCGDYRQRSTSTRSRIGHGS
jgi:hypothetical protein